jgi:hypothetical protein
MLNCRRSIAFSISKSVRLRIKSVAIPDAVDSVVVLADSWLGGVMDELLTDLNSSAARVTYWIVLTWDEGQGIRLMTYVIGRK